MKTIAIYVCWTSLVLTVLYLAIGAGGAALQANPLAGVGLGLIGLGACIHVRRQQLATPSPTDPTGRSGQIG